LYGFLTKIDKSFTGDHSWREKLWQEGANTEELEAENAAGFQEEGNGD
jgi:hypothetical protein